MGESNTEQTQGVERLRTAIAELRAARSDPACVASSFINSDELAILERQVEHAVKTRGVEKALDELVWTHRNCYRLHEMYLGFLYRDIAVWVPLTLLTLAYSVVRLSGLGRTLGILGALFLHAVFYSFFRRNSIFIRANRRLTYSLEAVVGGFNLQFKLASLGAERGAWSTSTRRIVNTWSLVFLSLAAIMLVASLVVDLLTPLLRAI